MHIRTVALSSRLCLAPLAGYTTLAFRLCMRELGGFGLATTELIHARAFLEGQPKALALAETRAEDTPLSVQLFGPVAEEVRDAALQLQERGAELIDINMGCPVDKVVKIGAGAAMLKEPRQTARFIETITRAVTIPVTVKTRLGWAATRRDAAIIAPLLADAGVAALTIHGRTRADAFGGSVDLAGIRRVVESVRSIPVFGNGDIRDAATARRMLNETGCAGLVIGRAAVANPWVFHQIRAGLRDTPWPAPSLDDRIAFMTRHFLRSVELRGEKLACLQFRKVIDYYARSLGPCKPLRLAMKELSSVGHYHDLVGRFLASRCQPHGWEQVGPAQAAAG